MPAVIEPPEDLRPLLRALWQRRCVEMWRRVFAAEEARLDAELDALVDAIPPVVLRERLAWMEGRDVGWTLLSRPTSSRAVVAWRRRRWAKIHADFALLDAAAERREASRLAEQIARVREQQAASGYADHGDVLARASRYLATIEASGSTIFEAAIRMVRGFSLAEEVAVDLMWREYLPRMRTPAPLGELQRVVRRASRANRVGWGWLLAPK